MKTWVIVIHQMVKNLKSKPKNDELILTKDQSESYKWNINIIVNLALHLNHFNAVVTLNNQYLIQWFNEYSLVEPYEGHRNVQNIVKKVYFHIK